jgi:hypothetical protein
MKLRNIVMTLLLAIGLMMVPQLGTAGMVTLSEEQLNDVTAQGGLSFQIESLNLNMTIDTLAYGDKDGLGAGSGTGAGYISLCGVTLKGAAQFASPLTIDIATAGSGAGRVGLTGLNMTMTGMNLQVDRFSIDAIRLGSEPGIGGSLGSIYMSNMAANITGKVQVRAN